LLIGAQPGNQDIEERLLVTGKGLLDLKNVLGLGENLYIDFERLQPESQEINLRATLPFIPNVPFGATGSFSLLKQDSSYITVNSRLGVLFPLSRGDYFNVFWDREINNIIQPDTAAIRLAGELPEQIDTRYNGLGTIYQIDRTNDVNNPRKGFSFNLDATGGLKTIRVNGQIADLSSEEVDFEALYDSLGTSNIQTKASFDFKYFLPVGRRNTVLLGKKLFLQVFTL